MEDYDVIFTLRSPVAGEILIAWQKYSACSSDEINLKEGDVVELLDTNDPVSATKKLKLDPELDSLSGELLDTTAARHKLSVKPRRKHASSRHSPTRLNINARWLVRGVDSKKQGWVPCRVLQTADDPVPGSGLPGDAAFRRMAVVKELVETEQEFVKDLDHVVQRYLSIEITKVPKVIRDNFEVIFGNLTEIAEFHRTVLMEGVKYYANEPLLLGKTFLRLERDFDKHVSYCRDEPSAQDFLDTNDEVNDYFEELSHRLSDDKSISEHLKLPIQRINDYQLLLKELVRYSACLGENHDDLQKALELMLSIPSRAQDDKFTSSIEGYRGSIHKLGRLLAHDRFSVTFGDVTKERYLFLFKARILITKVRRISDERSIFQLKDIIRLPQVEVRDHPEDKHLFELVDKVGGQTLFLKPHRDNIKEFWLQEVREFAKNFGESEESGSDEFRIASPPTEPSQSNPTTEEKAKQPEEKPKQLPEKKIPEVKVQKVEDKTAAKTVETKKSETKTETKVAVEGKKVEKQQESSKVSATKVEVKKQETTKVEVKTETQQVSATKVVKDRKVSTVSTPKPPETTVETPKPVTVEKAKPENPVKPQEERKPTTTTETTSKSTKSESSTSSQVISQIEVDSTSESRKRVVEEESEEHHLKRIKAVEPLVHLHDKKVLEEVVPYVPKQVPEIPGSALNKLYSVESLGVSDTVITDYKVGVEVSVEVEDEMSRRYTSSARAEGNLESSYSRRSGASSYGTDGLSSSKYSSESASSKYGTDYSSKYGTDSALTGGSKYDSLSSKYSTSKSYADGGDSTSSYTRKSLAGEVDTTSSYARKSLAGEGDTTSSYARKSLAGEGDYSYRSRKLKSSAVGNEDIIDSYSRKMKGITSADDDLDYSSYTKRSTRTHTGGDDDGDGYSGYTRKSSRSVTHSSEQGDGDGNYSYSKRSIRGSLEGVGDGDKYSVRKSIRTSVEGTGLDAPEVNSYSSSYSKRLGDAESKYSIRSTSTGDESDITSKYARRSASSRGDDDTEELISKYSKKYSESTEKKATGEEEEEDKYAKYRRKYSRTDSSAERTTSKDEEGSKYTKRYSRTSSIEKKAEEEDPYEKYARKYLRADSSVERSEGSKSRNESVERKGKEEEESYSSKKYSRTESIDRPPLPKKGDKERESTTIKTSVTESVQNGKETKSESYAESHEKKSASYAESQESSSVKISKESSERVEGSTEKTATEKLIEFESESEERPRFIKTIRGANIEPGETALFDVALNKEPDTFSWLKDNKVLNGDSGMSGRIQATKCDKGHEFKLIIKQARAEDCGLYTAIATNGCGKASCSAQLIVHELSTEERADRIATDHPEFLVSMKDAELLEDTYLRFMVKVAGEPNPEVTFFKDGRKILENEEHYQVVREHSDKGFYELIIPVVKHTDAGVYKCVATNKFGENSSEATVTVTDNKQVFEDMPEGEILPPGEKPLFHWKKDGIPFEPEERFKVLMGDDEDSLALVFQHVKPDDVGLYTCVAQTSRGHISCSAELTVHGTVNQLFREPEKPKLVIEKKEPIVTAGGSAMLELQVKGYPKPNIKVKHEGKEVEAGSKYKKKGKYIETGSSDKEQKHLFLYEDEETMSLVIKNVQDEDAGKYTFTAENELGSDSADMSLTVKSAPKIKTEIKDMDSHADLTIKMEVEVEGTPKPSVAFYKDGKVVKKSDRIKVVEEGTKHTLVIEKSTLKDAGSYSIVASNELAQVSKFWNLDVYSKPKILEKLGSEKIVSQGETFDLKVKLEAEPKPEMKWYKDEEEIKSSDHFVIKEDGDSYIVRVTGAVTTDAARYKCKAVNIHGSVDDDITVFVKKAPKIIKGLQNTTVTEHDKDVTFDVKLESFPKPTVKWYLDEVEIKETRKEFTRLESDDGVKLVIKEVTSELSGQYTCKLSNECGAAETSAKLTVNCAPRIIKHLKDVTIEEGSTLHLEVDVEGCPTPTVKWLRNGREVSADARIKISRDTQRQETYNLAVNLIKYEEQGEYEVIVTNSLGTVSSKSYVTVHKVTHTDAIEETEEPPKKLKVEVIEDEPEIAEKADKEKVEEKEPDEPKKTKIKEPEEPKTEKGSLAEKTKLEVKDIRDSETPEPIVEEPSSPRILKRGTSASLEESATVELEEEFKSKAVEEKDIPQPKSKRSKSVHIEEIIETEVENQPKTPVESDLDSKKKLKRGISATKQDIEIIEEDQQESSKTPKTVDVDASKKLKRGISATKEDVEIIEEDASKSKTKPETVDIDANKKLKRGISATKENIDTIEEEVSQTAKKPDTVDIDANKKLKRGISSTKEDIDIIEEESSKSVKKPDNVDIDANKKLKRGISATKEEKEEIEEVSKPKQTDESDLDTNRKLKRGISSKKESIEVIEEEVPPKKIGVDESKDSEPKLSKGRRATVEEIDEDEDVGSKSKKPQDKKLDRQESQKAKRDGDDDDAELNDLLNRAQRQRSLVEDSKSTQAEAVPQLLDTNMTDGSRPESLDLTYIVRGTANPLPTAKWTLNGKEITPDGHLRMTTSQNGEEFRLEIQKLEMKDAGTYECILSNPLGEVRQQAVLEVTPEKDLRRPKIKEGLKDETIIKKNIVIFKAVVIGDPIPDIAWIKDGKELTDKDFEASKIILESEDHEIEDGLKECTFSLSIPRCERSNAGKYKLKAKNKWGEAESSAQLTIILRPEIEGPEDVSVIPGEATEFTVVIQSNPVPEVTWSKDGQPVEAGEFIKIVEDVANETYKLIFHKVLLADEGYYKVTAKNKLGEASSEARLKTITERPKFITGLIDEHVEDRGEVTVMVRADGLPKPEIRWFYNGKPIVEDEHHKIFTESGTQVTSSLSISNYGESDVGLYKAVAVNVVGEAETTSRISMLQTPPSFGKRLDRNEECHEGEPLELKAKVNGSPKPTVAWFKDGEPLPIDDDNIKTTFLPDGTVKLNILNAKPGDSGAYKLVVKNANGETACLCAVAVTPKPRRPKFLKVFKDAKVPLGEELRLEAKIEAYPPPEIKWLKDGLPIRASSNVHMEKHPDGSIALVVDCMRPENAGKYQVIISNKLGDCTSDAKVEVEKKPTKPEFITKLSPQTVVEGFPVKFEVKAIGFPAPKITWSRNGAEVISDNKHIKIIEEPEGVSILLLDSADEMRDALTYKAVASNEAGIAETSAALTVISANRDDEPEERPIFMHNLKDIITDEGQPLILEAPFTGNPIPSAEWTKDGVKIEPSDRILMTCDGRRVGLRIDKALPSDAGVYGVTIVNPLGKDSTQGKAIVHKVFQPPSFTQKFTDLQQLPNRDAKFPCRVSGVPQPEVAWTKDGEPITESDKFHIKRDGDACCLYVMNCQPKDAGVYRATATNKEGQDVCTAALEVVKEIKSPQRIEPPVFLKRIGDTELFKAMTAKFTACASGIPEPEVEWFHNDQKIFPSTRIRMERDQAGLLRLTISGVDVDDLGKYSCKISNEHGSDICHATLKFDEGIEPKPKRPIADQYTEFDKYKRSGAPVPISDPPIISQMTDRHCTLSWNPSIPSGPRSPVTYQLEMCELPNGDWFTVRSGIRSCTCGVRNLEPFRDYKFRVRVENKYGISEPSPYAITHREKLEPDLPKFRPFLPPEIDFRPDTSPYFPKDFDIERPPHDGMAQAPRFLRQEHDTQYGVKDQNTNLFWFVYGYPKPKVSFYFNDELIEGGGRFDSSYTRNGQATLFINKMLDRDVGWYEAVARNEHGEARQRVRLEIAEAPYFIRRPDIEYVLIRGRARFEARILGVPYPEIKWYKDWKPLADSSRIKITFTEPDTTVLTINDVINKDDGLYSVSARNVAGSSSASAMLHVDENNLEFNWRTYNNLCPIKAHRRPYLDLYDIGDELGRGTQGITYHAVERLNGRNYAAKIMHGSGDLRPFMYNELEMLNELRHRKLISLHDAYETDDSLALILELASGGELVSDLLLRQDYYTESDIAGYIRQLLQGLDYMHDRGYAHLGLNLGDLLIAHPGGDDLKITDFGLARRINFGHYYPLPYGVPEYVSPECASGDAVGFGHDMWSVGIMTYILLSGRSPFRGMNDMETLIRVREGKWSFDDEWWSRISLEGRDFISKLLVFEADGRMDVRTALRHPWFERADKRYQDEFQISSRYLSDYWRLYREWYDNASCRRWFRRRPLEGAFTHPSRMVYPPGEFYSPRATPAPLDKIPRPRTTWEDQLPSRSPLNYEIGAFKSESHYQNGPDTYLLQLRDVDFPVRLREYMKVAVNRGPGAGYIVSNENGYDWNTPIIRERRRFTDVMDEEIDDERRARINRYGTDETGRSNRRLKHELGSRLDTYVEAEAFLESKQDGRLPFFREKPQFTAMVEGKDLELTCMAVGEPQPIVQWFKSDAIVAESHRIKITTDDDGRSHYKLSPALAFDQGMYKVVARNKVGQTIARTRIVLGLVPDEPDSPEASQVSDTEILLTWKPPKHDGNSTVICYKLEYKLADDMEWIKKADNIDHEFYLIKDLEPSRSYIFRLSAKNAIGWSDAGVPSAPIQTKIDGSSKIKLNTAMQHLQQITDAGTPVEEEKTIPHNYGVEAEPIEWENINLEENYNIISEIFRGQFSTVLKAVDKRTDTVVVAKLLDISGDRLSEVEGEFAALRSLRHERIAGLLAAYKSNDIACFILEKLQGANILTYLASKHEYTEQTVATIVSQVLDGIQYLHWRGLCHLDLQPDNVIMCGIRSVQVKLGDLGSAHRVTKLGTKVPLVGHPDYISPEVLSEEPAFPQTDIWTVGVLTYIMLSGTLPFRGQDENESRQNILFVRYRFENLYQEVSQEATRFLMLLFKRQPNKRPSPEECHENRWLLPTDYMIKKRERAVFLGHRIKEYSEEYHSEKVQAAQNSSSSIGGKFIRSQSIQEELLTAP